MLTTSNNLMIRKSPQHPAGTKLRSAITMIEIVIVLLILAITAATATPRLSVALQGYRLQSATKRLILDLELARSYARNSGRDVTVSFEPANNRYTIHNLRSLDRPHQAYAVDIASTPYHCEITKARFYENPSDSIGGFKATNSGDSISAGDPELTFDRFELPNRGGAIELKCGNLSASILIDADTGEIKLL